MAVAARLRQSCFGLLCTWAACGVLAGPQREEPLPLGLDIPKACCDSVFGHEASPVCASRQAQGQ